MTVFAITTGNAWAITLGNDTMMLSEVFSAGSALTVEKLRCRLDDFAAIMPPEVVFIDRRRTSSVAKQALTDCVARFAERQGVGLVEVGARRYRSRYALRPNASRADVAEAAARRSGFCRSEAEADCLALFDYGLDEFFKDA